MNNCIEQRLARNFSYQKNSGYTRRYVGLKVNTTLRIECSGEENIKP
jgi:hypothetical protein